MTAPLASLADQYRFNAKVLAMATAELPAEAWSRPPAESGGNPAHWILGHLVTSRAALLRKLGGEWPEAEWEPLFGMHAQPTPGCEGYPSTDELSAAFGKLGELLGQRLEGLDAAAAAVEWGAAFPDGSTTLGGGARFLFFHESYHLGQLGLLRRIAGLPGFV